MNFSRISNRTLPGRLLRFPLRFIPPATRMPILQGRLRGKKWIVGSSGRGYTGHGYWLGSYEYEMRRLFENTVTEGSIVFDIGAHVGFYTLLAAVLVGPRGTVYAFEPVPRNLAYLKEHLAMNRVTNVTVIEAAASDRGGVLAFEEGPDSFMGSVSPRGNLQVRAVSLDELISRGEAPTPDYVKIDVEGAEMRVLLGARGTLTTARPTLFLSVHGRDLHRQCCQFLRSLGYQLQPVGQRSIERSEMMLASRAACGGDQ